MSTRSGKRIHSSFENIQENDTIKMELKSEKKTRSKRQKDNTGDSNANTVLNKTAHYVHYPGDEVLKDNLEKTTRKLRRHTLKEHNICVANDENIDTEKIRHTRKTKKFIQESQLIAVENNESDEKVVMECPKKIKKNKKKTKKQNIVVEPIEKIKEAIKEDMPKKKKKSKNKKHLKQLGVLKDEDANKENIINSTLNKSNASIDSFHSAAGSPESCMSNGSLCKLALDVSSDKDHTDDIQRSSKKSVTPKNFKRKNSSLGKDSDGECISLNGIFDKDSTTKRKSSRTRKSEDQTIELIQSSDIDYPAKKIGAKKIDSSFNSSNTKINVTLVKSDQYNNSTDQKTKEQIDAFDKSNMKKKHIFEKFEQKMNETFEASKQNCSNFVCETNDDVSNLRKSQRKSLNSVLKDESVIKHSLNSTLEKSPYNSKLNKTKSLDATFDKGSDGESLSINDHVQITDGKSDAHNATFDKTLNKSDAHNATFDKFTNKSDSHNATFDKSTNKSDSHNATFDKSTNNSHISINSDDSKTENIINTTPQLIESSIEESNIHISPKSPASLPSTEKRKGIPITPLKREGTYTKDSPKVVQTPKAQEPTTPKSKDTRLSINGTPNRRKSLPSPGRTPFPASKTSEKKKNVLNLTHSIEKSVQRASLAETNTRTTKVMFCSPINHPAIASQIKRKVIKSNLKGSNKSFVFDESMSETTRSANRKRSYTQSEADTVQRKRSRIGEEMQQSVDRLSRPRTVSATAKLSESSTPSKSRTPTKARPEAKVSRTKLPNFAALHQKRFDKMESLDECQERKAKRARQLLTPTGSVNLLERVSPKEKEVGSPKTSRDKEPKKHTLESLNPGYTRFGFRMNCEENPFGTFEKKNEIEKVKPNGLRRQATLPSLAGTTSLRREAAKQSVMREKSFAEKRDTKRKENRTIIKGVRTNRRFELQMKMRNINA